MVTCIILFTYLIHCLEKNSQNKSLKRVQTEMNSHEEEVVQICNAIDKNSISTIPPKYRYYYAAQFLYEALVNQRAMDMQEAVNLYEDYLYKQQMMQQQQQQNAMLRSIANTSAFNATVNTANYINNLFK